MAFHKAFTAGLRQIWHIRRKNGAGFPAPLKLSAKPKSFADRKECSLRQRTRAKRRSHVCRLRSVFSEAHVPGKNDWNCFSPSEAKNQSNLFFPGTCASEKTLLSLQTCERLLARVRCSRLPSFFKQEIYFLFEEIQLSSEGLSRKARRRATSSGRM